MASVPGPEAYVPRDKMYLWWLVDPGTPRLVGDLDLVERGRGVAVRYAPGWLADGLPLSEDLPLETRQFLPGRPDSAAGAPEDARPDRWGERVIRVLDQPRRLSLLEYLYFAGNDRFGALGVSLSREVYAPSLAGAPPSLADVGRIHEILGKVAAGAQVDERERRLVNPGRSMGGAQPKSLVFDARQRDVGMRRVRVVAGRCRGADSRGVPGRCRLARRLRRPKGRRP